MKWYWFFPTNSILPQQVWMCVCSLNIHCGQWCTEEGGVLGGFKPPLKFRSFDKAEPNSQFCGKYIRYNPIGIRVSPICKFSGTPD
jgi:hypothetical protein